MITLLTTRCTKFKSSSRCPLHVVVIRPTDVHAASALAQTTCLSGTAYRHVIQWGVRVYSEPQTVTVTVTIMQQGHQLCRGLLYLALLQCRMPACLLPACLPACLTPACLQATATTMTSPALTRPHHRWGGWRATPLRYWFDASLSTAACCQHVFSLKKSQKSQYCSAISCRRHTRATAGHGLQGLCPLTRHGRLPSIGSQQLFVRR